MEIEEMDCKKTDYRDDSRRRSGTTTADDELEFAIIVDRPLQFGREYNFTFNFYQKFENIDDSVKEEAVDKVIKEIVDKVMEKAKQQVDDVGYTSSNSLTDFLEQAVDEKSDELSKEATRYPWGIHTTLGYLSPEIGEKDLRNFGRRGLALRYSVEVPNEWNDTLADLVLYERSLKKNKDVREETKSAIIELSRGKNFKDLVQRLRDDHDEVKENDIKNLIDSVESLQTKSNPLTPFETLEQDLEIHPVDKETLQQLRSDYTDYIAAADKIETAKAKIVELKPKTREIRITIANAYVNSGAGKTVSRAYVMNTTELKSISLGTVYGLAYTGLNLFEDAELDMFRYAGIKFFFGPVDKNLHDPYLVGWRSKVSLFIGLATNGDLTYKGGVLADAAGTKPLLGGSVDINRYVTLDIGSVWFRQDSVSPENSEKKLRAAPYIGLSFDFDVLNNSQDVIKKLLGENE
ncbi:hypothetical protein ACFL6S_37890 [Candidatus Poribacteria bacterium]